MSWIETTDKWLEDNSTRGGIPNRDSYGAFISFLFKLGFYIMTVGFGYLLVLLLRTKDEFFFELIRSKNHPIQNLEDKAVKKRIDAILESELITLGSDEEVLYLIEDESIKDCGVLITNSRIIYKLFKPKAVTVSTESGQMPLSEMANKVQAKMRAFVTISINGEAIGKISAQKGQPIEDFLNAVRKSLQNEKFSN
mgnify:CR=1 FL=1